MPSSTPSRSALYRNGTLLAAASLFARLSNIAALAIMSRAFSSSEVGYFVISTGFMAFAFLVADVGVGQWTAREVASGQCDASRSAIRADATRVRLLMGSIVTIACVLLLVSGPSVLLHMFGGMGIAAVFQSFAYHFECLGRGIGRMGIEATSGVVAGVLFVGGVLAVSWISAPIVAVSWVMVGSSIGRLAVARLRLGPESAGRGGRVGIVGTIQAAASYLATTVAAVAFVQADVILIAAVADAATAAQYALLSRPVMAVGSLIAYASNALVTHGAGLGWTMQHVRPVATRMVLRASAVSIFGVVGLIGFGPSLFSWLYGEASASFTGWPLLAVAPYLLFALPNALWGALLTAIGEQGLRARATWIALFTSVVGVSILVPTLGLVGASLQLVLGEVVLFGLLAAVVLRRPTPNRWR